MPGLAGVYNFPPERIAAALATQERVAGQDGVVYEHCSFRQGGLGMSNTWLPFLGQPARPAVSPTTGRVLLLEGICHTSPWPRAHGGKIVIDPSRMADSLLEALDAYGLAFLPWLRGSFNGLLFDPAGARLTIFNDRFASLKLHYTRQGSALVFASERKAILSLMERRRYDELGLLEVFALGHNQGQRTWIEGVRCLGPASILRASGDKLEREVYWRPGYSPQKMDAREAAGEMWRLVLASTRRQIRQPERTTLSLSGGLDSRVLAGALARTQPALKAYTYGEPDSLEVACARQVAEALAFDHDFFPLDPANLEKWARWATWRTDAALAAVFFRTPPWHQRLKREADYLVSGQLGDTLAGVDTVPSVLGDGLPLAVFSKAMLGVYSPTGPDLGHIFAPSFLREFHPQLRSAFQRALADTNQEHNSDAYAVWNFEHREHRLIFCSSPVDSHCFQKIRPFIDIDLYEFCLRLPRHLRLGQALYRTMMQRHMPELAKVPDANCGMILRGAPLANQVALAGASLCWLSGLSQARRKPASRKGLELRSAPALGRIILEFASGPGCDSRIFNPTGIRSLLREHYLGGRSHTDAVALLLNIALGWAMFMKQTPTSAPSLPV